MFPIGDEIEEAFVFVSWTYAAGKPAQLGRSNDWPADRIQPTVSVSRPLIRKSPSGEPVFPFKPYFLRDLKYPTEPTGRYDLEPSGGLPVVVLLHADLDSSQRPQGGIVKRAALAFEFAHVRMAPGLLGGLEKLEDLTSGVSVICDPNRSGKSTTLRLMQASISSSSGWQQQNSSDEDWWDNAKELEVRKDLVRYLENIEVLWKDEFRIDATFEVENNSSIYSSFLRFADLTMVAPNTFYPMFTVAFSEHRQRVVDQVRRPSSRYPHLAEKVCCLSCEKLLGVDNIFRGSTGLTPRVLEAKAEKLVA